MAASKFGSEQYAKHYFTDEPVAPRPTGWELALHAGNPGQGDDNEVSGGTYERQPLVMASVDAGDYWEAVSQEDVIFPAAGPGQSYTVTHWSVRDSSTGECLAIGALAAAVPIVEGGIISFPSGFLKVRGV